MEFRTVSIIERKVLVDKHWKPDDSMLMHVATIDDWGADRRHIEENKQEMLSEGLEPTERILRIIIEFG